MNKRAGRRALFSLLAMLAAAPALADPPRPPPQAISIADLPEERRAMVMIELASTGRHAQAAQVLQDYPLSGPHAANRTLFIEGLILRASGDLKGATAKFRAALAADPSLTMVRAELAITLNAMGESDSAKHHLEQLMAEAPDTQAAGQIKSFIDSIDANRPFKFSSYVSLAPSTNVNNGTSHDVIYLNDIPVPLNNQEESGVGFSAGINAGYTYRLNQRWSAVAGLGLNGSVYEDDEFNTFTASQVLDLRREYERGYVGIGPIASQTLTGGSPDFSSYTVGARLSAVHRLTPRDSLQSISIFDVRTYQDAHHYDSEVYSEQLTFSHSFSQDFVGSLFAGIEYTDTRDDLYDNMAFSGGIGVYKELPHGVTLGADARIRFADYEDIWALPGEPRQDIRYTGRVSLTKRDWNILGYAPEIEYSYTENDSNFAPGEFTSHTLDVRLTKDF